MSFWKTATDAWQVLTGEKKAHREVVHLTKEQHLALDKETVSHKSYHSPEGCDTKVFLDDVFMPNAQAISVHGSSEGSVSGTLILAVFGEEDLRKAIDLFNAPASHDLKIIISEVIKQYGLEVWGVEFGEFSYSIAADDLFTEVIVEFKAHRMMNLGENKPE